MSTPPIIPTGSSAQISLQGVASGGNTGGATSIPPGILALPDGTLLRGNIIQADATTHLFILRTPKGDLTLKSELPLERGSELVIRLDTATHGLKARIISVDGLTPRELEAVHPTVNSPPHSALDVEDVIDLAEPLLSRQPNTPTTKALPPSLSYTTGNSNLIAVTDSVEIATPQPLILRAALLARSPELPQLLQQLPSTVYISPQRLEAGATLSVIPHLNSIRLPLNTTPSNGAVLLPITSYPAVSTPEILSSPLTTATANALSSGISASATNASTVSQPQNPALSVLSSYNAGIQIASQPSIHPSSISASTPVAGAELQAPVQNLQPTPTAGVPQSPLTAVSSTFGNSSANTADGSPVSTSPIITTPFSAVNHGSANNALNTVMSPATSAPLPAIASNTSSSTELPIFSSTSSLPVTDTSPTTGQSIAASPAPIKSQLAGNQPAPFTPFPAETVKSLPSSNAHIPSPLLSSISPPPQATESQFQPLLTQGIISAQVIGTEQSGETVLKTPLGVLKLDLLAPHGQRLTLPPESIINLQLVALEGRPDNEGEALIPGSSTQAPAGLAELSKSWNSLKDMLALLQQTHPHLAQELMQTIPQPGPKMARDILFFLLALKTSDDAEWIGKKTIETLELQQRGDLVRKLGVETGLLRQFYTDSPNPNWQAVFIPIHFNGEWQQTRLFVKKEKPHTTSESSDNLGTRFIMEVDLSRLGPLQFDGFIKKHQKNTSFDLIIRSAATLPVEDQQAIRTIFTDAAALTGFHGSLNFQTGQPFPVLPMEDLLKSDRNVIA